MTALERLIDESTTEAKSRAWYANAEFERKAKATVKAMAEVIRRSVGQKVRYIAARAAQHRQGGIR